LHGPPGLDFYASLSALNFIRSLDTALPAADRISQLTAQVALHAAQSTSALSDPRFLQPVLPDDPLLYSFDRDDESDDEPVWAGQSDVVIVPTAQLTAPSGPADLIARYQDEVRALREHVAQMAAVMQRVALSGPDATVSAGRHRRASDSSDDGNSSDDDDADSAAMPAAENIGAPATMQTAQRPAAKSADFASPSLPGKKRDQGYFDGYSTLNIHEEMLRDTVRTLAYRDFMYQNKELFRDKVVLDIGCGTSILSLFAAEAGARRVIGMDRAAVIDKAQQIVAANGKAHVVTLVKGRVEETPLPVDKVLILLCSIVFFINLFYL
jgi:protein arginine N-methyltransferase 3